jgi:hypothetical protein
VQLSGVTVPLHVAEVTVPESTWKVNAPVGTVLPVNATLAVSVLFTAPKRIELEDTVTVAADPLASTRTAPTSQVVVLRG